MDLALASATGIVWFAAVHLAYVVGRGGGDQATRWHLAGFSALAMALTLNLPPVYRAFDRLVSVPNLAEVGVHALALTTAWCAYAAIVVGLHTGATRQRRINLAAAALLLTTSVMLVLFMLAPVDTETTEFTTTYAAAPYVAEYYLAYLSFSAYVLADIAWLGWRYRRAARLVGVGLQLLALGAACGLVYVAQKATYIALSRWSSVQLDDATNTAVSRSAMMACALFCVAGATLPRIGAAVLQAHRWCSRYLAYLRLGPLWSALTTRCPEVVLSGHSRRPQAELMAPRDVDFRLYRRVIEIRDAQLVLRNVTSDTDIEEARRQEQGRGRTGRELEAATEAALTHAALSRTASVSAPTAWAAEQHRGDADFNDEVNRLLEVARFFDQRTRPGNPPSRWLIRA